jgi:hypothetical protein
MHHRAFTAGTIPVHLQPPSSGGTDFRRVENCLRKRRATQKLEDSITMIGRADQRCDQLGDQLGEQLGDQLGD